MNNKQTSNPTDSELTILEILWEAGPQTVRFVNDFLSKKREVGYTTTLKLMQIMTDKGLVTRNTDQRTHVYKANVKEQITKKNLLKTFITSTFQGSASSLVMQALGDSKTSPEELKKIKALIRKLENKENSNS